MRALDDLVRAGKVLYVGISDAPAWIVAQSNTLAELRGWSCFAGSQIEYSLIERTAERELLPMARSFGLATTTWGVAGQGVLTGKFHRAADPHQAGDTRRAANVMLARAYGGTGEKVERPGDVRPALQRGLEAVAGGRLALVHVVLAPV
jgi:aryl-alcohol dehydrogenase-like predicted oxidoreductase